MFTTLFVAPSGASVVFLLALLSGIVASVVVSVLLSRRGKLQAAVNEYNRIQDKLDDLYNERATLPVKSQRFEQIDGEVQKHLTDQRELWPVLFA